MAHRRRRDDRRRVGPSRILRRPPAAAAIAIATATTLTLALAAATARAFQPPSPPPPGPPPRVVRPRRRGVVADVAGDVRRRPTFRAGLPLPAAAAVASSSSAGRSAVVGARRTTTTSSSSPSRLFSAPAAAAASSSSSSAIGTSLSTPAIVSMVLLAIQFGAQPTLTKKFTPSTICRSTVVVAQEIVKFVIAASILWGTGGWERAVVGWTIPTWLTVAGIPAALYCVQNYATLMAYQNLPPVTFNVLNQTKTLSAALCCYLLMGRRQSKCQIASLFVLLSAALVIEKVVKIDFLFPWAKKEEKGASAADGEVAAIVTDDESSGSASRRHFALGVVPVLLASFISGLAGALVQKNLQTASGCGMSGGRNSYLFTMELCVASLVFLLLSTFASDDGKRIRSDGFFRGWTPRTMIPVATNAAGGVVVGLVTKYAGSVRKGFALIFGLLLSGLIQARTDDDDESAAGEGGGGKVTKEQVVGGLLASVSLWMHSSFPYVAASP